MATILISGGASGLGAAIAAAVADAGDTPVVLDLSADESKPDQYRVDVSDTRATEQLVSDLCDRYEGIDGVVTAAGIDHPAPFGGIDGDRWERIVAVNLFGTAAVVRGALPALEKSHGRIVLIASSLALRALPDASAYCASKFGVLGFARSIAQELQGRVGVTTIIPAGMDTRFFDGRDAQYRPGPDANLMDASEAANAVMFALSRPKGVEVRELVICPDDEPSWP